jgi:hypothetical protein
MIRGCDPCATNYAEVDKEWICYYITGSDTIIAHHSGFSIS